MDAKTQVAIASNYNAEQEWNDKVSVEFQEAMNAAMTQAAIGTKPAASVEHHFLSSNGFRLARDTIAWISTEAGRERCRVMSLNLVTGEVTIRLIGIRPDTFSTDPKNLEVIEDERPDEHPED